MDVAMIKKFRQRQASDHELLIAQRLRPMHLLCRGSKFPTHLAIPQFAKVFHGFQARIHRKDCSPMAALLGSKAPLLNAQAGCRFDVIAGYIQG